MRSAVTSPDDTPQGALDHRYPSHLPVPGWHILRGAAGRVGACALIEEKSSAVTVAR